MKRQQIVKADNVVIVWTCLKCNKIQNTTDADIGYIGGCGGHGPEEYCYCNPVEFEIITQCSDCEAHATVRLSNY